jgi:hypothetical protein
MSREQRGGSAPLRRFSAIRALLLLFALLGISGCDSVYLLGIDASQGIVGIVLIGPSCPVQPSDGSCPPQPYSALITIRRSGDVVTLVRSDADGRFRVGLKPGRYEIVPESGDPFPHASPQDVDVVVDAFSEITVLFDTGIR